MAAPPPRQQAQRVALGRLRPSAVAAAALTSASRAAQIAAHVRQPFSPKEISETNTCTHSRRFVSARATAVRGPEHCALNLTRARPSGSAGTPTSTQEPRSTMDYPGVPAVRLWHRTKFKPGSIRSVHLPAHFCCERIDRPAADRALHSAPHRSGRSTAGLAMPDCQPSCRDSRLPRLGPRAWHWAGPACSRELGGGNLAKLLRSRGGNLRAPCWLPTCGRDRSNPPQR
jgi:hypothetical protein